MTADQGSDPGRQRTVAELLEQYGVDRSGGGRRRRRAAEPEPEPDPSPPSASSPDESDERSWSNFDPLTERTVVDDRNGGYGPGTFGGPGTFATSSGTGDGLGGLDAADWSRPSYGAGGRPLSAPDPLGPAGPGSYPESYRASIYQGESFTPGAPGAPEAPRPGETTEQMPRYPAGPPEDADDDGRFTGPITGPIQDGPGRPGAGGPMGPMGTGAMGTGAMGAVGTGAVGTGSMGAVGTGPTGTGAMGAAGRRPADDIDDDGGPSTEISSRAALFDDEDYDDEGDTELDDRDEDDARAEQDADPADAGGKKAGRRFRRSARKDEDDEAGAPDAPAGLDEGDEIDEAPSPIRVWATLIGLGIVGAVGGGALWIGFRYLWLHFPLVALVAALVATAGLVVVIRTLRGSEDLRTTMMAVLVGLIVTISPAVLLLTSLR